MSPPPETPKALEFQDSCQPATRIFSAFGWNMVPPQNHQLWLTFLSSLPESFLGESFCCCSVAKLCLTLCDPIDCSMPGSFVLHYLPEFAQIYVHWVTLFKHLIFCCPPLLLPSIFHSISVFSNEHSYKATSISHSLHTYPHHFIVTPNFIKCFLRAGGFSYFLVLFSMFNGNLRNNDDFVWTEFDEEYLHEEYLHVPAQWIARGLVVMSRHTSKKKKKDILLFLF